MGLGRDSPQGICSAPNAGTEEGATSTDTLKFNDADCLQPEPEQVLDDHQSVQPQHEQGSSLVNEVNSMTDQTPTTSPEEVSTDPLTPQRARGPERNDSKPPSNTQQGLATGIMSPNPDDSAAVDPPASVIREQVLLESQAAKGSPATEAGGYQQIITDDTTRSTLQPDAGGRHTRMTSTVDENLSKRQLIDELTNVVMERNPHGHLQYIVAPWFVEMLNLLEQPELRELHDEQARDGGRLSNIKLELPRQLHDLRSDARDYECAFDDSPDLDNEFPEIQSPIDDFLRKTRRNLHKLEGGGGTYQLDQQTLAWSWLGLTNNNPGYEKRREAGHRQRVSQPTDFEHAQASSGLVYKQTGYSRSLLQAFVTMSYLLSDDLHEEDARRVQLLLTRVVNEFAKTISRRRIVQKQLCSVNMDRRTAHQDDSPTKDVIPERQQAYYRNANDQINYRSADDQINYRSADDQIDYRSADDQIRGQRSENLNRKISSQKDLPIHAKQKRDSGGFGANPLAAAAARRVRLEPEPKHAEARPTTEKEVREALHKLQRLMQHPPRGRAATAASASTPAQRKDQLDAYVNATEAILRSNVKGCSPIPMATQPIRGRAPALQPQPQEVGGRHDLDTYRGTTRRSPEPTPQRATPMGHAELPAGAEYHQDRIYHNAMGGGGGTNPNGGNGSAGSGSSFGSDRRDNPHAAHSEHERGGTRDSENPSRPGLPEIRETNQSIRYDNPQDPDGDGPEESARTYHRAMGGDETPGGERGLNARAKDLAQLAETLDKLYAQQTSLLDNVRNKVCNTTIQQIKAELGACTDAAAPRANDDEATLAHIGKKIKSLCDLRRQTLDAVGRILNDEYQIAVDHTSRQKTLSSADTRIYKLPPALTGAASNHVANDLMAQIMSVLSAHWIQTWAIYPVIHRMFYDVNGKLQRWKPTDMKDVLSNAEHSMLIKYPHMRHVFRAQSVTLYDWLTMRDRDAVEQTHETFQQPNADDTGVVRARSAPQDAVSTLYWWTIKHFRKSFQGKDRLMDLFNFASSLFHQGSIIAAVKKIRKYLPAARRLKLKLHYHRTIARMATAVQNRHNAFVTIMEKWINCSSRIDPYDCLGHIDQLLSEIEYKASTLHDKVPLAYSNADSVAARATFDGFEKQYERTGAGGRESQNKAIKNVKYDTSRGRQPSRNRNAKGGAHNNNAQQRGRAGNGGARPKHRAQANAASSTTSSTCCAKGCTTELPASMVAALVRSDVLTGTALCRDCFGKMLNGSSGKCTLKNGKVREKNSASS